MIDDRADAEPGPVPAEPARPAKRRAMAPRLPRLPRLPRKTADADPPAAEAAAPTRKIARPARDAGPVSFSLTPAGIVASARRHVLLILASAVVTAGLVVLGASLLKPRFLSTAQVYIDPRGLQVVQNDITTNTGDANSFTNLVESQALIVLSDKVIRPVVEQMGLGSDSDFAGRFVAEAGETDPVTIESSRKAAIDALKRATAVRRPERTSVLEITVAGTTANRAADLANAVAQSYLTLVATTQSDLAQRTTGLLTERLDAMRKRVREAESKVQAFKTSNNLIGTDRQSVTEGQLNDANSQLGTARARVTDLQSRYDQIVAAQRSPELLAALPEALLSATVGGLRSQDLEAQRQLAAVSAVLGDQHPTVRAAAAQAVNTRRALTAELQRIAASARGDLKRAQDSLHEVEKTLAGLTGAVADAGQASVQLRELERDADASRSVYQAFLNRARETGELAGLNSTNASIVTAAIPAPSRAFPPRLSLLGPIGAVAGLGIGLGLGLALDRRRMLAAEGAPDEGAFADEDDGAGAAPRATPTAAAGRFAFETLRLAETAGGPALARQVAARLVGDVTLLGPFPPAQRRRAPAEAPVDLTALGLPVVAGAGGEHAAFLAAVLNALRPRRGEEPSGPCCLVVAGANGGLERTTLAVNLALAARASGARTMLMDYDTSDRALTRLAGAVLQRPPGGNGLGAAGGRLFHATANAIGLVLLPERTPMAALDPLAVAEGLFDGREPGDLLICDGPARLAEMAQAAGAEAAFAAQDRLGLVLAVDQRDMTAFPPADALRPAPLWALFVQPVAMMPARSAALTA